MDTELGLKIYEVYRSIQGRRDRVTSTEGENGRFWQTSATFAPLERAGIFSARHAAIDILSSLSQPWTVLCKIVI
jgi:hypothetical protein